MSPTDARRKPIHARSVNVIGLMLDTRVRSSDAPTTTINAAPKYATKELVMYGPITISVTVVATARGHFNRWAAYRLSSDYRGASPLAR